MNNNNNFEIFSNKINIFKRKILFMGYGAVAKCVLNYFSYYFIYDFNKIFIVDRCISAIYGPNLEKIPKKNIFIETINSINFINFLKNINFQEQDIIIDLTSNSRTYYFIEICLLKNFNYINTSIEDGNDLFRGRSIDVQQKKIHEIYENIQCKKSIKSNLLIEFGMNPGLIQHFILYALNEMNKKYYKTDIDNYSKKSLVNVIDNYNVGTILLSEIDNVTKKNDKYFFANKYKLHNTWSILGLFAECFDNTEIVYGIDNKYIKPTLSKNDIDYYKTSTIPIKKNQGYKVLFLNQYGLTTILNSICPIINENNNIKFIDYYGSLIHHGEMFEMANYFGKKSPLILYVYKINKYVKQNINEYFFNNISFWKQESDFRKWIYNTKYENTCVFDNINKDENERLIGHDSIGCTIFCGEKNIDRIFWCGSILNHLDKNVDNNFTPTIIQVATGVLSGLSYILEEKNKNNGLMFSCDLDTKYILNKSIPLLGRFFFTEIPIKENMNLFKNWHISTRVD